jgi:hypothetical protein
VGAAGEDEQREEPPPQGGEQAEVVHGLRQGIFYFEFLFE